MHALRIYFHTFFYRRTIRANRHYALNAVWFITSTCFTQSPSPRLADLRKQKILKIVFILVINAHGYIWFSNVWFSKKIRVKHLTFLTVPFSMHVCSVVVGITVAVATTVVAGAVVVTKRKLESCMCKLFELVTKPVPDLKTMVVIRRLQVVHICNLCSTISVHVAQWLEHLTDHQKVTGCTHM